MARRFENLTAHDGRLPRIAVLQLPPPAIQYLTAHVEASDGIGVVRTLDESRGIIECWVMPDFQAEFDALLDWAGAQWPLQRLGREFE